MSVNAGFVIHHNKSVLNPTQNIQYLGFRLDSNSMTVTLTEEKVDKLQMSCLDVIERKTIKIKTLAKVVGQMVASFPGVLFGKLFYRLLDNHKTEALRISRGNFNAMTTIPKTCLLDLQWWADNIKLMTRPIVIPQLSIFLESDASKTGWGVC